MNAKNYVDNSFKELNKSLKKLQAKDLSLVPENMTVQDVAETGDRVITSAPFLTNELILEERRISDLRPR